MPYGGLLMLDIILKGGIIADGTINKSYTADVCIKDGMIVKIAPDVQDEAAETVDVSNLVVAPGFIDFHSHSDNTFMFDPRAQSKLYQGVTSELSGQCGLSNFPVENKDEREKERDGALYGSSMDDFINRVKARKISMGTNQMLLTGHGALRQVVAGLEDREVTATELELMRSLLEAAMECGCWGMSLGLGYAPGVSSTTDELCCLSEIVQKYGGIITSHMRNQQEKSLESMNEMYDLYRHSGAKVHIAHFKSSGQVNWGQAPRLVQDYHNARAEGIEVTADVYPYEAACSGITNSFPKWAIQGGIPMAVQRTKNQDRQRLLEDLSRSFAAPEDGKKLFIVTTHGKYPTADGKFLGDIAEHFSMSLPEALMELTQLTDGGAQCIAFGMSPLDVEYFLKQDDIVIGSDGSGLSVSPEENDGNPHPRNFGTFPRFLRLAREKKFCSMERAVHRITGQGAEILGMYKRGFLREGFIADITVFDWENISDMATYENPVQKNRGIEHVLIKGSFALRSGEQTDKLLGEFLRKR